MHLYVGIVHRQRRIDVPRFQAATPRMKASTFSCDIAYSDSPAAARASS